MKDIASGTLVFREYNDSRGANHIAHILFRKTMSPLVWGGINGGVPVAESKEELCALLRAAAYSLGLPRADELGMRSIIQQAALVEHRTAYEDTWRKALYLGHRTEEHDHALIAIAAYTERLRKTLDMRPFELNAAPVCLDPGAEERGVPWVGLNNMLCFTVDSSN